MSGRGEQPDQTGEQAKKTDAESLTLGESVYNEAGKEIGRIRGIETGGVFVTTREGVEAFSVEHARSGHDFGEAYLMWRCMECGEMGEIPAGLPDTCPNCDTRKENLMWWTED